MGGKAGTLVKYYRSSTHGFQPGNTYGRLTTGMRRLPTEGEIDVLWARAVEEAHVIKAYDERVRERMEACREFHRIEAARKLREEAAIAAIPRSD